jgi:hypothetical protein
VFTVSSSHNGDALGEIRWYSPWRRYVFYPNRDTLYDAKCLIDITYHIQQLMEQRNESKR